MNDCNTATIKARQAGRHLYPLTARKGGTEISDNVMIPLLQMGPRLMISMAACMRDVTERFEEMRALKKNLAEATKAWRACNRAPVRKH